MLLKRELINCKIYPRKWCVYIYIYISQKYKNAVKIKEKFTHGEYSEKV